MHDIYTGVILLQPKMDTKAMIAQMSDSDLAKQLKSLNENIGPVTPNSRPLYERRLMKYFILEQAASCTIPYTPPNKDDACVSQSQGSDTKYEGSCHTNGSVVNLPCGVSNESDVHSDASDHAIFFGVQLQADDQHSCGENSFRLWLL